MSSSISFKKFKNKANIGPQGLIKILDNLYTN